MADVFTFGGKGPREPSNPSEMQPVSGVEFMILFLAELVGVPWRGMLLVETEDRYEMVPVGITEPAEAKAFLQTALNSSITTEG